MRACVCRLKQKHALKLLRMSEAYIASLHIVELSGRFNSQGQGLDIVETAAIYGTREIVTKR